MLRLAVSLAALILTAVGRDTFCGPKDANHLAGYNLPECKLADTNDRQFWRVNLQTPHLVRWVSLSVRNPQVLSSMNFTVTVDGKFCAQIQQYTPNKILAVTCQHGGIVGSRIEWKTQHPIPAGFKKCNFNVCGSKVQVPLTKINLLGQRATQSSTDNDATVASMGIDAVSGTCTKTMPYLTNQPWWKVDMGAKIEVHYLKITNRPLFEGRLGNVVVTVDDKFCTRLKYASKRTVAITCDKPVTGKVLKIQLMNAPVDGILTVCDVQVFGVKTTPQVKSTAVPEINLLGLRAAQSSTWSAASVADVGVDGNPSTCTHTYDYVSSQPWWTLDMGTNATIHSIKITNREWYAGRLKNVMITLDGQKCGAKYVWAYQMYLWVECDKPITGRVLKIQLLDAPVRGILTLCEVQVWGYLAGERYLVDPIPKVNLIGLMSEQSSTYKDASHYAAPLAIDGNTGTCTWTNYYVTKQPWWKVTMTQEVEVHSVKITNHRNYMKYLGNVVITVDGQQCGPKFGFATIDYLWVTCPKPVTGRVLTIQLMDAPFDGVLSMCEVEVWGFVKKG